MACNGNPDTIPLFDSFHRVSILHNFFGRDQEVNALGVPGGFVNAEGRLVETSDLFDGWMVLDPIHADVLLKKGRRWLKKRVRGRKKSISRQLTVQKSRVYPAVRNLNWRLRAPSQSKWCMCVSNESMGMIMVCISLLAFAGLKNNQLRSLDG